MFKKLLLLCSTSIALLAGCSDSKTALYKRIAKDFYQQCCIEKGYLDDSSFCGYYEPRLITEKSILPFVSYGQLDNTYVLSFAINGFHYESNYVAIYSDNSIFDFDFNYSYKVTKYNELLAPQVWKDGKICSIFEAYKNEIIGKQFFTCIESREERSIYAYREHDSIGSFSKKYTQNLPHLKNNENETKSLLIPKFQSVKDKFYQKEIADKHYKDDSEFRKNYKGGNYLTDIKVIDEDSLYLDNYIAIDENVNIYFLTINDIAIVEAWFTYWSHLITFGDYEVEINHFVDPILEIDNDIYFLLDAYGQGLINEELAVKIYDCLKVDSNYEPIPIEHKLQERKYSVNIRTPFLK